MAFDERNLHDITILDFTGRLTYSVGAELSRRVSSLATAGRTKVVLNLERVSYLDSAGLGALVEAFTHLRDRSGVLKFVNPNERTRHVLAITGIGSLVETFATEVSAVASFEVAPS